MRHFRRSVIWGAGVTAILTLALGAVAGWRLVEEEMCIRRLDSSDEAERRAAAERLGKMKSSRAVAKLVALALKAENSPGRQSYAGDALLAIGGAAVPPLLEEVDGSYSPRETTARSLLEKLGRDAAHAFLAGARHGRKEVRAFSLSALEGYVNERPDIHAALVKALEDPEWEVRLSAVRPLVKVIGRDMDILRLLMGRLEDPQEEARVRYWAAFDMPALGLPARAAQVDDLVAGGAEPLGNAHVHASVHKEAHDALL